VAKATPSFPRWEGARPRDTFGGKDILDLDHKPVFAEIAILRLFEKEGWQGVWVDGFRNKYRTGYWDENATRDLPAYQRQILNSIQARVGESGGCFDVFCWRDGAVMLAEAKRVGRDQIRPKQQRWLQAALDTGFSLDSFLLVEWALAN
jgi:hypothetical protein